MSFFIATLGSILDFQLMLKIWQVPACKMEPRSGIIFCQKPAGRPPDRVNILPEGKTPQVSNSTWCLLGVSMMSRKCLVGVLKVSCLSPPIMSVPT